MSELWDYSLQVYPRPGFQQAAIHLQDARGSDVNLLIYVLWLAATGRPALTPQAAAGLAARMAPLRAIAIEPIRELRRALKGGIEHAPGEPVEEVRKKLLGLELDAEQIEQAMLLDATDAPAGHDVKPSGDPAVAAAGLAAVAGLNAAPLSDDDRAALSALMVAGCPDAGTEAAQAALDIAFQG
jgi:uncharacterized protein (TIGR02444 family)